MSEGAGAVVEMVAVGDELLLGDTLDSNGAWLGQRLAEEGIRVVRRTIVGDEEHHIVSAIRDALGRTRAVICCGGLGATQDDRTRAAAARLYGWPLELDAEWLEVIRERFTRRGMMMPEINRLQAEVPRGAAVLRNEIGTAPGLILDDPELGITILLPGVPSEFRWLTENGVISYLKARLPASRGRIQRRVLRTMGIAESALAEKLADIEADLAPLTLAFLPTGLGVDLRITAWGDLSPEETVAALDRAEQRLRERLGTLVYGTDRDDLAALVGAMLRDRGLRVAVAESCTGGLLSKRLTDSPGASAWMLAGVVPYADAAKHALLDVDPALIREHGAVSEEVATAMLEGAMRRTGAECALSITGIAGPGGGSPQKPVGTVWIGAAAGDRREVRLYRFAGTRPEIRARAAQAALKQLFDLMHEGAQWHR